MNMIEKKTISQRIFDVFNHLFMIFLILVTLYPLLYVVFASLSDPKLLMGHTGFLFRPLGTPTLEGYKMTLNNPSVLLGYRNTIFYVVVGTLINLILTSLGAFCVTRKHFMLKTPILVMVTVTMFFSGGMIPTFILVQSLGMYNTIWAILLPGAISSWNLILMKTFFQGIPDSMEEAAMIDGANDWHVFCKIILPLSKPIIAVMVLYYGVARWNSWFDAMIYLRDRAKFPLQLFLREILMLNASAGGQTPTVDAMVAQSYYKELLQYCVIVVATVPILCIYPFLQKYFVKGVMVGAVKG